MKKIKALENQLTKAYEEKRLRDERRFITCGKCNRRSQLRTLIYIQDHWYTSPSGCIGGDYWNLGEGQFVCPKCGIRNRMIHKYGEKFVSLKSAFKGVRDKYGDERTAFVNI